MLLRRVELQRRPPGALPCLEVGLSGSPDMSWHHVFQGYGETIPTFLWFDGPVENKKPSKKEVVNILKDAWKERLAQEQVSSHQSCWPSVAFISRPLGGPLMVLGKRGKSANPGAS